MQITFDTKNFAGRPKNLTNALYYLVKSNSFVPHISDDIESITCRTPSETLRYCRHVTGKLGVSPKTEAVFLKNPSLGLRYLRYVGRETFQDNKIQTRFWKRIVKKPELALGWGLAFNKRLSETEEEVFMKSMRCMKEYAASVIRGKFPDRIHEMIILKSFDTSLKSWEQKAIKDYVSSIKASA